MAERIITDANGRKHITTEPLLHSTGKQSLQVGSMIRPRESDYKSYVSYTRALEEYCDWLICDKEDSEEGWLVESSNLIQKLGELGAKLRQRDDMLQHCWWMLDCVADGIEVSALDARKLVEAIKEQLDV